MTSDEANEANLAQAESKLQSDKDNLAAQVCKNVTNIAAVQLSFRICTSNSKPCIRRRTAISKAARAAQ